MTSMRSCWSPGCEGAFAAARPILCCRPREGASACTHLKVRGREVAKARATRFPPPMWGRDREGGGDGAPRADLLQRADSRNQESCNAFARHGIENNRSAGCTPLPVPPPHGGRERCGTALPHLSRCIRVRLKHVCMRSRLRGDDKGGVLRNSKVGATP